MAKLKARGRTEIFRIEREEVRHIGQIAERTRVRKAIMSDGNILISHGHDGRWTHHGKVKPDITAEQLLANYLDRGWRLTSSSPQYLVRRGHSIEDLSQNPIRTTKQAEHEKKAKTQRMQRRTTARSQPSTVEEKKNGPGFYVTNATTSSYHRAAELGPYQTFEEAERKAWKRMNEFLGQQFDYLLPVAIIEAVSRDDAEQNVGHVWWINGNQKGPPVDPRQMKFANGF